MTTPPSSPSPRSPEQRFAGLSRSLRVGTGLVAATAATGTLVGGDVGTVAGVAVVVAVVAAPVVRVGWLGARWYRRGDRRFAGAAAGLLGVVAVAAVVALVAPT